MKPFALGLLALAGLVGLGIYFAAVKVPAAGPAPAPTLAVSKAPSHPVKPHSPLAEVPAPDRPTGATTATSATPPPKQTASAKPKSPYARIVIKQGQPIPELTPFQAERDQVMNLAASQDAKQIPSIAGYLEHSDATVREASRQALIQLGDASAVSYLKAAAESAKDPTEAELLREAAEFLGLPKLMDVLKAAQSSGTASSAR